MKKTSRIKITLPTPSTREDAEAMMTELARSVNAARGIVIERDARVMAINQEYETGLGVLEKAILMKTDALHRWAEANPTEFPKNAKSIKLTSGTLGFRTGTPKLVLLSRAWSWARVLEAILARGFSFVRSNPEVDKERILAFVSAGPESPEVMAAKILKPIGVKVVQDESFYAEPDLTKLETRKTVEAA